MLTVIRVEEDMKNYYPTVEHSTIQILTYRTIGVITVNLQHNLLKCV